MIFSFLIEIYIFVAEKFGLKILIITCTKLNQIDWSSVIYGNTRKYSGYISIKYEDFAISTFSRGGLELEESYKYIFFLIYPTF